MPILLLIVFAIIDFGRMLNAQIAVTEAAREGARVSSFGGSMTDVQNRVNRVLSGATATRPSGPCPSTPDPDRDAEVLVTYNFQFVTPFATLTGATGFALTATGIMPCHS
jgi:TadE-like protein